MSIPKVNKNLEEIQAGELSYHIGLWLKEANQISLEERVLQKRENHLIPKLYRLEYASGGKIIPAEKYESSTIQVLPDGMHITDKLEIIPVIVCLIWQNQEQKHSRTSGLKYLRPKDKDKTQGLYSREISKLRSESLYAIKVAWPYNENQETIQAERDAEARMSVRIMGYDRPEYQTSSPKLKTSKAAEKSLRFYQAVSRRKSRKQNR
jgi:hypothetical protein